MLFFSDVFPLAGPNRYVSSWGAVCHPGLVQSREWELQSHQRGLLNVSLSLVDHGTCSEAGASRSFSERRGLCAQRQVPESCWGQRGRCPRAEPEGRGQDRLSVCIRIRSEVSGAVAPSEYQVQPPTKERAQCPERDTAAPGEGSPLLQSGAPGRGAFRRPCPLEPDGTWTSVAEITEGLVWRVASCR